MGNLQVRGASVMLGYYQNPEENRKAFTADGWFVTGDVGFVTNGKLTVTARAKDEIIINGVNYPAAEIEAIVDAVKDVEVSFSAACAVRSATGTPKNCHLLQSAPSATGGSRRCCDPSVPSGVDVRHPARISRAAGA